VQQNPSREAKSGSAGEEIPDLLWNAKDH